MLRERVNLTLIVKHWFTYHPWLKLISLLLAIAVWFYVKGEIGVPSY